MSSKSSQAENSHADEDSEACPVIEAINEIGSEWRLLVLHDLADAEEKRFNELKRSTGASSRTLSRVLEDLQESGLVDRRVEDQPIATYYSLTESGAALCPVFDELRTWAERWRRP
ncbi:MAG: winged helix-turn-helix transcriptional regulator [Halodesulfurarchaeum sp.]